MDYVWLLVAAVAAGLVEWGARQWVGPRYGIVLPLIVPAVVFIVAVRIWPIEPPLSDAFDDFPSGDNLVVPLIAAVIAATIYRQLWQLQGRLALLRIGLALIPVAVLWISPGLRPDGRAWRVAYAAVAIVVLVLVLLRYGRVIRGDRARYRPDAKNEERSPLEFTADDGGNLVDLIDRQFSSPKDRKSGLTRPGGNRAGWRNAHSHGSFASGRFEPLHASEFTDADVLRGPTDAIVRFSNMQSAVDTGDDRFKGRRDNQSSVRGMAIRLGGKDMDEEPYLDFVGIDLDRFVARDREGFMAVTRAVTRTRSLDFLMRMWGCLCLMVLVLVGRTSVGALAGAGGRPESYVDQTYHGVHTFWWHRSLDSGGQERRPVRYRWEPMRPTTSIGWRVLAALERALVATWGLVRKLLYLIFGPGLENLPIIGEPKPGNELEADLARKLHGDSVARYELVLVHGGGLADWRLNDALRPFPRRADTDIVGVLTIEDFVEPDTPEYERLDRLMFSPAHLRPGITPSDDEIFAARVAAYPVSHRRRVIERFDGAASTPVLEARP